MNKQQVCEAGMGAYMYFFPLTTFLRSAEIPSSLGGLSQELGELAGLGRGCFQGTVMKKGEMRPRHAGAGDASVLRLEFPVGAGDGMADLGLSLPSSSCCVALGKWLNPSGPLILLLQN